MLVQCLAKSLISEAHTLWIPHGAEMSILDVAI